MMLAEPTPHPDAARERTVELMFEKHGPPALFLARDAVLAAFATGRQSAIVVDAGHDATTGEFWRLGGCLVPCLHTRRDHTRPLPFSFGSPSHQRTFENTQKSKECALPDSPTRSAGVLAFYCVSAKPHRSNEQLLDVLLESLDLALQLRPLVGRDRARDDL